MKTNYKTDFEIFNQAIVFAKERGYTVPPMEWAVLVKGRDFGKTNSLRMWAIGLIYSHDFLKAFFGENLVPREEDNENMMAIGIWAEQVAYEHEGRIYAAQRDKPYMSFVKYDDVEFWADKAPTAIIEAQVVTKKLQDLAGSVPVQTHKIKKVRVDNLTPEYPAWKHGLRRMAEYDNPFLYLKSFMDYNKDFEKKKWD